MRVALNAFLDRAQTIEGVVTIRDHLVAFGRVPPKNFEPATLELHSFVRSVRESGLQPTMDGCVLLLSAAFEQFVTDAMIAYVADLPSRYPAYSLLPNAIRSANERLTGEALSNSDSGFEPYEKRRFVDNLRGCLAGDVPYVLNGDAIAFNRRNLTGRRLRELIGRLGIGNIWNVIAYTRALREWSPRDAVATAVSRAQSDLAEFIADRNQIAHRVGSAAPGPEVVRLYLRLSRALAKALVESLEIISAWRHAAIAYV